MGNSRTLKSCRGDRKLPLSQNDHDFYSTPPAEVPNLIRELLANGVELNHKILEPACGNGCISKALESLGFRVYSYDLIDRGYGTPNKDFLNRTKPFNGDIITNPPFSLVKEFMDKSLELLPQGGKAIFLIKLNYLSGKKRYSVYKKYPPKLILVYSSRIGCFKGGKIVDKPTKAMDYCWVIFEKGYTGKTELGWIGRVS